MFVAIVDDEEFWREKIGKIVKQRFGAEAIVEVYSSGVEFNLAHRKYDIVLMDTQMPLQDGYVTISDYQRINEQCLAIMLTSKKENESGKYFINPFRYVDKSRMERELDEALEAACRVLEMNRIMILDEVGEGIARVKIRDMIFLDISRANILIHTELKDYKCREQLSYLQPALKKQAFFQCHKSYIINLDKVEHFDKKYVYFKDNSRVVLSSSKYNEMKNRYLERLVMTASM